MAAQTIKVGQLLLDVENPRHGVVSSQRDAISEIISQQGQKLVAIAEHIGVNGLNPADNLLVMPKGKNFVVLEGNRRLAAIRLLANPDLADGHPEAAAFKKLAKQFTAPSEVDCAVVADRDEARVWILLRHAGESGGVGVVNWGAAERERFAPRPGTQVAQGLAFVEAARAAYPENTELQQNLDKVHNERISTIGRLVADSEFKRLIGTVKDGHFQARYTAAALQAVIEQILKDFATTVSVSQVKNQAQRAAYLGNLTMPPAKQVLATPTALDASPVSNKPSGSAAKRRGPAPKPGPLLKNLNVNKLGKRVVDILAELRKLDVTKFPNAASLMLRAVLELSVDQIYAVKGWTVGNTEFKNRIRKCLGLIDPTNKDPTWLPVRTGLQDASSLHSVSTLHAYVHHPSYHPTAGDIRNIAANLEPFLQALNDLV